MFTNVLNSIHVCCYIKLSKNMIMISISPTSIIIDNIFNALNPTFQKIPITDVFHYIQKHVWSNMTIILWLSLDFIEPWINNCVPLLV